MTDKYKVSVPGSLMLLGEHAVLHNKLALSCAIDKRIILELTPRLDKKVSVTSVFGSVDFTLEEINNLPIAHPWEYVLAAIKHERDNLFSGFDLNIQSEFSSEIGLGSSAAVTVAVIAALHCWLKKKNPGQKELLHLAREVIRETQGTGSGADAAASIYGGIVQYRMSPIEVKKIADSIPLIVVYSGKKVPTKEAVMQVARQHDKYPRIFAEIFGAMEQCVLESVPFIAAKEWAKVGEVMNLHHGLQVALGTSNLLLEELVMSLAVREGIFGAKISGSGLGDCVIGCGKIDEMFFPINEQQKAVGVKQISVMVSEDGVLYY